MKKTGFQGLGLSSYVLTIILNVTTQEHLSAVFSSI